MSLKEKINKTSTFKPKIETELDKINSVVIGGGGTSSKTLAEVPNNLTTVINGKKKIAILESNKTFSHNTRGFDCKFTTNLEFTPSRVIVKFLIRHNYDYEGGHSYTESNAVIDSKFHNSTNFINELNDKDIYEYPRGSWSSPNFLIIKAGIGASITKMTNTEIVIRFDCKTNLSIYEFKIQEIIAIE